VLTLPAICSDAWSLKNLVRELGLLCGPSAPGEAVDAEPLQYADFAQWHHELLEEEEAEEGREFWRKQSYPTAASLSLPFENRAEAGAGGPAAPGLNINRRPLSLAPETASRIAEVAQTFNVEPRCVLLGC